MLPLVNIEEYEGYSRYLAIQGMDAENMKMVRKIFAEYKLRGIITEGKFDDPEWRLSNEVKSYRFRFAFDEKAFKNGAYQWAGCSHQCFSDCIKAYIIFHLGINELSQLSGIARELGRLSSIGFDEVTANHGSIHVAAYLKLMPGFCESRDQVIEILEEQAAASHWRKGGQRKLSDFRNYLTFDKEIKKFWTRASDEDKKHYFPVYFWWSLTAILPLRATEFLLIPSDCLRQEDGKHIISIRRTLLKKRRKKITYRINTDYERKEYEIPGGLAREILYYQEMSVDEKVTDDRTLLLPSELGRSWYMTYGQLSYRLKKFLSEAISRPDLKIQLGDTRHLAMINLILSGGSPVICKELAGHEDIDISSNYYANLSSIIESTVYEYCHSDRQGAFVEGGLSFPVSLPKDRVRIQDGWCGFTAVAHGDVSECMKNYSRLGDCVSCVHFYPDRKGLRMKIINERKEAVDSSSAFLIRLIELVRQGNGMEEDISATLARLQNDGRKYAEVLRRKYEEKE